MKVFISRRRLWFTLSAILILVSVGSLLVRGLNLGVDFTGGVLMDLQFEREVETSEVREILVDHGLGHSQITVDQRTGGVMIRTPVLEDAERVSLLEGLSARVADIRSSDVHLVSPVIAEELLRMALLALVIAIAGMIIYISLRFEFKFALAAITALMHDALLVLGFFSLLQIEVSSAFIPAILTIMGYSINDTIVVFDRIRENLKYTKKRTLEGMVEFSIGQTLRRSIYTSLTTLTAVTAIYVFGGKTTQLFALALLVGVMCGTYSSIFLASPLWMSLKSVEPGMRKYVRSRA